MFKYLREQMQGEEEAKILGFAVTEAVSDTVKDRFLTDPAYVTLGAENDPEIEKLVQSIPEYLPNPNASIDKLTESLLVEI